MIKFDFIQRGLMINTIITFVLNSYPYFHFIVIVGGVKLSPPTPTKRTKYTDYSRVDGGRHLIGRKSCRTQRWRPDLLEAQYFE